MNEEIQLVKMTKKEAIKYYANKIVEDSLEDCTEFNYCMYFEYYEDCKFIEDNKEEILKEIEIDPRVMDVYIDSSNNEYSFDMVFSLDYCPCYYEDVDISKKIEKEYLKLFVFEIKERYEKYASNFRITTRELIRDFINKNVNDIKALSQDDKDAIYEKLKEHIDVSGFNSKYMQKYEVIVDNNNLKEFIDGLEKEIENIKYLDIDRIKKITRQELDEMLEIHNNEKQFPLKYKGLFIFEENGMLLGIDNTSGDLYMEDFDNLEQCVNYLNNEEEEENENEPI